MVNMHMLKAPSEHEQRGQYEGSRYRDLLVLDRSLGSVRLTPSASMHRSQPIYAETLSKFLQEVCLLTKQRSCAGRLDASGHADISEEKP